METELHKFLISPLDEGKWSVSFPGRSTSSVREGGKTGQQAGWAPRLIRIRSWQKNQCRRWGSNPARPSLNCSLLTLAPRIIFRNILWNVYGNISGLEFVCQHFSIMEWDRVQSGINVPISSVTYCLHHELRDVKLRRTPNLFTVSPKSPKSHIATNFCYFIVNDGWHKLPLGHVSLYPRIVPGHFTCLPCFF